MIITPNDQASKRPSDTKVPEDGPQASPEEPPPSYSPQRESAASGSVPSPHPRTFKTNPTNLLALFNENNSIRGEFVIDPSIRIPSSMLPPLGADETEDDRKNLCLKAKCSSVDADIWLLCPPRDNTIDADKPKPRRTTIVLASDHGSIHAQVRTLDGAAPFSLTATAPHGTIRLALPRSFQGLLSLSTRHGTISVSDPLVGNGTQLSQLGATRRYFIGDFRLLGEDEWRGDQVEIDAVHGSIRIKYVDEVAEGQGTKSFWSRLLGN